MGDVVALVLIVIILEFILLVEIIVVMEEICITLWVMVLQKEGVGIVMVLIIS